MNIVFDLGGVVFRWQPDIIIKSIFSDLKQQQLVEKLVFQHPDWAELDRGTLSIEQATKNSVKRTGMSKTEIKKIYDCVPNALIPIQSTIQFLESIKNSSNDFYVLSNMQLQCLPHLQSSILNWDMFRGVVFSCEVNHVKPEEKIYSHLLDTYNLIPHETVFIDDMHENLVAASKLGIKTILFQNAQQCCKELQKLGCF